jgi:hypothetical protein
LGHCAWVGPDEYASPAYIYEPVALAADLHDGGVMDDAVEHGGCQHSVAGKGCVPTAKSQIGHQDQRALFIEPCNHLNEHIGLLASERQIADFVDDQKFQRSNNTLRRDVDLPLPVRGFQFND